MDPKKPSAEQTNEQATISSDEQPLASDPVVGESSARVGPQPGEGTDNCQEKGKGKDKSCYSTKAKAEGSPGNQWPGFWRGGQQGKGGEYLDDEYYDDKQVNPRMCIGEL